MAIQKLMNIGLFNSISLQRLIYSASMVLLLSTTLTACGPKPDADKTDDETETSTKASSDDELEDAEESSPKKVRAPKVRLSTEGKPTGQMVDGYAIEQQNEFLGLTKLKLSKLGARLESPNLTCIIMPGKEAIAYNPDNGNSMQLTTKSAAMLAGKRPNEGPSQEVVDKDKAVENIAGLKCNKYVVHKFFFFVKPGAKKGPVPDGTGKTSEQLEREGWEEAWHTEIWATKDLKIPAQVMKDCARLTMMPPDLGFPMRIEKLAQRNSSSTMRSGKGNQKYPGSANGMRAKFVIDTHSIEKTKFDAGNFTLLAGYKPVKDEMALMMSGDESELDEMGLDDDNPKTKRKASKAPDDE